MTASISRQQQNALTNACLPACIFMHRAPPPNFSVLLPLQMFIDMPGAERLADDPEILRLREGPMLNRSLHATGAVLRALHAGQGLYVNYEESSLTKLLAGEMGHWQDCLSQEFEIPACSHLSFRVKRRTSACSYSCCCCVPRPHRRGLSGVVKATARLLTHLHFVVRTFVPLPW